MFIWGILFLNLTTAFNSEGFHHFDEHFQILEFLNFKLGATPSQELPWEFKHQIRSWFLPWLLYPMAQLFKSLNIWNPFYFATLLRIFCALFSFYTTHRLLKVLKDKNYIASQNFSLAYFLAQSSWFVLYIHARHSGENISMALLLWALAIYFQKENESTPKNLFHIGLLSGICFLIRYQMGFALAGAMFYFLLFNRKALLPLFLGGLLALAFGFAIDYWGYERLTFSAWNYFYANQVEGRSAGFGVTPWWDYFRLIILRGIPPWSLIFLLGSFQFFYKFPRHILTFICAVFFLGHMVVGHKELRFLYFIIALSPILLAISFPHFSFFPNHERLNVFIKKFLSWGQVPFIVLVMFSPAQEAIGLYKFFYQNKNVPQTIISFGGNPFKLVTLRPWFYLPQIPEVQESEESGIGTLNLMGNGPQWIFLNRLSQWENLEAEKSNNCKLIYGHSNFLDLFPERFKSLLKNKRMWMVAECNKA